MDVIGAEKAKKEFEELLSAYWAAQLAQLRVQPHSGDSQAAPDSQETSEKQADHK
jgi:hypothetical protein